MSEPQRLLLLPFNHEEETGGDEMCTPQGCALPAPTAASSPSEPHPTESTDREEV